MQPEKNIYFRSKKGTRKNGIRFINRQYINPLDIMYDEYLTDLLDVKRGNNPYQETCNIVPTVDNTVIVNNTRSDFWPTPKKKLIEKKNIVDAPRERHGKMIFFIFEIILLNI